MITQRLSSLIYDEGCWLWPNRWRTNKQIQQSRREGLPCPDSHSLKQTVDKRREGGAFCYDQDQTQGQQENDDRREPPLFADAQKAPELSQDR